MTCSPSYGFIAQLAIALHRYPEVTGLNPVEAAEKRKWAHALK